MKLASLFSRSMIGKPVTIPDSTEQPRSRAEHFTTQIGRLDQLGSSGSNRYRLVANDIYLAFDSACERLQHKLDDWMHTSVGRVVSLHQHQQQGTWLLDQSNEEIDAVAIRFDGLFNGFATVIQDKVETQQAAPFYLRLADQLAQWPSGYSRDEQHCRSVLHEMSQLVVCTLINEMVKELPSDRSPNRVFCHPIEHYHDHQQAVIEAFDARAKREMLTKLEVVFWEAKLQGKLLISFYLEMPE